MHRIVKALTQEDQEQKEMLKEVDHSIPSPPTIVLVKIEKI